MTYQLKILTTALCSVLMLGKKLSSLQWVALLVLFSGVAIVQYDEPSTNEHIAAHNQSLGLCAVIACTILSAFAACYFERILKNSKRSLWILNVQLAATGVLFSTLTLLGKDSAIIEQNGFFSGYDWVASSIILIQAVGGLAVSVTVKYADNILKGFATSASIVISCIASIFLFNFQLSFQFCSGAGLVMLAIYMYSKFALKSAYKKELLKTGIENGYKLNAEKED